MTINRSTERELQCSEERNRLIATIPSLQITDSPMPYLDRRMVSLIMTRMELFKKILTVQGCVVECGVYKGNSLMTFFHLSNILEPNNFNRKIIGFDTFSGFPTFNLLKDPNGKLGHLSDTNLEMLKKIILTQEEDKFIPHMKKVELIEGDAMETIPAYVKENSHLIVALLYLDFDLYEPTKVALEKFLPLVPKGGIVGFDQLNQEKWAGETIAFKEQMTLGKVHLQRLYFDPHVSFFEVC